MTPLVQSYVWLAVAIIAEVTATSALKACEGFTRLAPTAIVVIGYVIAFYCMSQTIKTMSVGVAYAIWCGAGIILIAGIAWVLYRQPLDAPAVVGMGLIIAGVAVMQLFSKTTGA